MKRINTFIITTELPARITGSQVRNFNLIKQLSKDLISVSLFTIVDKKEKFFLPIVMKELNIPIYIVPFKHFNFIKKLYTALFKRVIPYMEEYKKSGLTEILIDKINEEHPDIIQLETLYAYYAVEEIIPFIKEKNIKIIFDAHNVEETALKDVLKVFNPLKRLVGEWILPNFVKLENKALKSSDHVFTCSIIDATYFMKIVNSEIITVIPNGADTVFFTPKNQSIENTLLFMGQVKYPPNEEALKYYFSYIHPLIRKVIPDLKMYILCGKPPEWLKKLTKYDPSVIYPGIVQDVRDYIDKATICVAPIKSGSGTRLKILEYMAMGKPVVSSSKGAEGIEVENNKNILIADNPTDFAKKIIWLFQNLSDTKKIGENARKFIKEKYDWGFIIKEVELAYQKVSNETD